jgi:hypothetical protein
MAIFMAGKAYSRRDEAVAVVTYCRDQALPVVTYCRDQALPVVTYCRDLFKLLQ